MENKSSNGWKFFALLFGGLLAALVGLYIYKQQNPDYDPWEEPWENSSSPVDLGLNKAEDEPMTRRKPPRPKPDRAVFQRKKPRNRWMSVAGLLMLRRPSGQRSSVPDTRSR